ncbi:MAG: metal ABC transporter permease [Acidimicrobiales bacterium]
MTFLTSPIEWWIDPFSDAFMREVLALGLLLVLATSVVGTWVVLRGMSFLGDALAHGVVPGIAIAFVLGTSTTVGALIAALAMVSGVSLIRTHSPLPEDTSIGVLFVGFLALGVVVISSHTESYAGDLTRFLFGSVSGVTSDDLVRQAAAAAIAVGGVIVFYRAFLVLTFDEAQAQLLGLRPRLAHAVLLGLLAITIVASFQTVGSLLVFAFLVAPPATAAMLVKRVPLVMATAVVIGSAAVLVGLLVSFHHETATGATMSLVAVVIFLVALIARAGRQAMVGHIRNL